MFIAYNPFGPQSNYISVYQGTVNCPKPGRWGFATVSDDASFLLVDGELVAEWPGRNHDIQRGRRGQMGGERDLRGGRHAFEYVGFAFDGPKRMEAAWLPPGQERWEVIPPVAFPAVGLAEVARTEDSERGACAAFDAQPAQYLESGDARMVASMQFTSQSSAAPGAPADVLWD